MSGNVFKRGTRWYARITHNGRQIWRTARTKTEAQNLLKGLRADIDREKFALKSSQPLTLAQWSAKYLEIAKVTKDTWKKDRMILDFWAEKFGDVLLPAITREEVRQELIALSNAPRRLSLPTCNRYLAALRRALSVAVEAGELQVNVLLGFHQFKESPARQPVLNPEDEAALLAAARPWMAWLIRLALATGARQGELVALTWRDVDFEQRCFIVRDSKSGESRRIPIPVNLEAELRARRDGVDAADSVVPGPTGGEVSCCTVASGWMGLRNKIGRPDLRFHDLRHVAASRLLSQGATLPEVAAWLGHKTLSMSRRYAHVSWKRLSGMVDKIS